MQLTLTDHALMRCQQRGISREALEIVCAFGKIYRTRKGFGCEMDDYARQEARMNLGEVAYRRIVDKLDFYMIVDPERTEIITVAHRIKRRKAA